VAHGGPSAYAGAAVRAGAQRAAGSLRSARRWAGAAGCSAVVANAGNRSDACQGRWSHASAVCQRSDRVRG
jgi:hypothetical protein